MQSDLIMFPFFSSHIHLLISAGDPSVQGPLVFGWRGDKHFGFVSVMCFDLISFSRFLALSLFCLICLNFDWDFIFVLVAYIFV